MTKHNQKDCTFSQFKTIFNNVKLVVGYTPTLPQ